MAKDTKWEDYDYPYENDGQKGLLPNIPDIVAFVTYIPKQLYNITKRIIRLPRKGLEGIASRTCETICEAEGIKDDDD